MDLNYTEIFNIFINLIKTAMPIAIFLFFTKILINFFFSLAFPKFFRGDK